MAGKSLYKRAVDPWGEDVKFSPRAKENKMFEKLGSEKVGRRNKSKAKEKPRSDHKHDYQPIVVWYNSSFNNKIYSYICCRCAICGKKEKSYYTLFGESEEKYLGELEYYFEDNKNVLTKISSKIYQKTIFLGGSKIINSLTPAMKEKIVEFMNIGHNIIIGDSMGADKEMQKVLEENNYKKVTVYYSGDRPRVNLGNWKTKHISSNKFMSDYERQKLKDNQMAKDCDYGYMLLQGLTKGTIANINKLLELNKTCYVRMCNKSGCDNRNITIEKGKDLEYIDWFYKKYDKR